MILQFKDKDKNIMIVNTRTQIVVSVLDYRRLVIYIDSNHIIRLNYDYKGDNDMMEDLRLLDLYLTHDEHDPEASAYFI